MNSTSTQNNESKDRERAEDYISSMISTILSMSAILATISVAILGIISKVSFVPIKLLIALSVLIAVLIFISTFRLGTKSYGRLILAVKSGKSGFDESAEPANKFLNRLVAGLIFLGIACFLFLLDIFIADTQPSLYFPKITTIASTYKIFISLGHIFIIIGSLGIISFATKFPLSSRIKDLKQSPERFLSILDGYRVWKWSWICIIFGALTHLIMIWVI